MQLNYFTSDISLSIRQTTELQTVQEMRGWITRCNDITIANFDPQMLQHWTFHRSVVKANWNVQHHHQENSHDDRSCWGSITKWNCGLKRSSQAHRGVHVFLWHGGHVQTVRVVVWDGPLRSQTHSQPLWENRGHWSKHVSLFCIFFSFFSRKPVWENQGSTPACRPCRWGSTWRRRSRLCSQPWCSSLDTYSQTAWGGVLSTESSLWYTEERRLRNLFRIGNFLFIPFKLCFAMFLLGVFKSTVCEWFAGQSEGLSKFDFGQCMLFFTCCCQSLPLIITPCCESR